MEDPFQIYISKFLYICKKLKTKDKDEFNNAVKMAKPRVVAVAGQINRVINDILESYSKVRGKLRSSGSQSAHPLNENINAHLFSLLTPDFISSTSYTYLEQFPRYLEAVSSRIEKFRSDPKRDASWQEQITIFENQIDKSIELSVSSKQRDKLMEIRWSIEELRVSLWAQQLKTLYPISFKRIERALSEVLLNV